MLGLARKLLAADEGERSAKMKQGRGERLVVIAGAAPPRDYYRGSPYYLALRQHNIGQARIVTTNG